MAKTYYDVTTPVFRLSFPHLLEPSQFEGEDKASYSCVMIFDTPKDLEALKEACRKALAEKWPKGAPADIRKPFRDGNEKAEAWGDAFAGKVFVRAESDALDLPPQVTAHPITAEEKEELKAILLDYCAVFGYDIGMVLNAPFTVITPDTANPYRQMYVAN